MSLFYRSFLILFFILIFTSMPYNVKAEKRRYLREANCEDDSPPLPPILPPPMSSNNEESDHKENSEIASLIAQKAAQEAKEASDAQAQAGAEAALEVKEELAERAEDAARAAQAALAGKQGVVDELEKEIKETEQDIKCETVEQQQLIEAAKNAMESVSQLETVIKQLQNAIGVAQQAQMNARNAGQIAQREAENKCKFIDANRAKLSKLIEKLKVARDDLERTMEAAKKAVNSAKNAESNASRQKRVIRQRFRRRMK